jgi:hypothetical protein
MTIKGSTYWPIPTGNEIRNGLLDAIDTHRTKTGMSYRAFGVAVARNPSLVARVRNGNVTLDLYDRVRVWLEQHRPVQ